MIPLIVAGGAALVGAALLSDSDDKGTWTVSETRRIIPENEVPPDILVKANRRHSQSRGKLPPGVHQISERDVPVDILAKSKR